MTLEHHPTPCLGWELESPPLPSRPLTSHPSGSCQPGVLPDSIPSSAHAGRRAVLGTLCLGRLLQGPSRHMVGPSPTTRGLLSLQMADPDGTLCSGTLSLAVLQSHSLFYQGATCSCPSAIRVSGVRHLLGEGLLTSSSQPSFHDSPSLTSSPLPLGDQPCAKWGYGRGSP